MRTRSRHGARVGPAVGDQADDVVVAVGGRRVVIVVVARWWLVVVIVVAGRGLVIIVVVVVVVVAGGRVVVVVVASGRVVVVVVGGRVVVIVGPVGLGEAARRLGEGLVAPGERDCRKTKDPNARTDQHPHGDSQRHGWGSVNATPTYVHISLREPTQGAISRARRRGLNRPHRFHTIGYPGTHVLGPLTSLVANPCSLAHFAKQSLSPLPRAFSCLPAGAVPTSRATSRSSSASAAKPTRSATRRPTSAGTTTMPRPCASCSVPRTTWFSASRPSTRRVTWSTWRAASDTSSTTRSSPPSTPRRRRSTALPTTTSKARSRPSPRCRRPRCAAWSAPTTRPTWSRWARPQRVAASSTTPRTTVPPTPPRSRA